MVDYQLLKPLSQLRVVAAGVLQKSTPLGLRLDFHRLTEQRVNVFGISWHGKVPRESNRHSLMRKRGTRGLNIFRENGRIRGTVVAEAGIGLGF
jgi:hypothetical protein